MMKKRLSLLTLLCIPVLLAACTPQEEFSFISVNSEDISIETSVEESSNDESKDSSSESIIESFSSEEVISSEDEVSSEEISSEEIISNESESSSEGDVESGTVITVSGLPWI